MNIETDELADIICSLDKMETITKVLNQTMLTDEDFSVADNQNLCAVLLREINYTKSKLQN